VSHLLLVRHAQASFLSDDYDQLSELGRAQARLLGKEWARLGWRLDAVFSGPRRRQIHTAEIVRDTVQELGLEWPPLVVLDELDEYRAEELMHAALPELVLKNTGVAELVHALSVAEDRRERARAFDRVLQAVMRPWARGELSPGMTETWAQFCARVGRGLERVTGVEGRGLRVAAFSSGGAIGALVARVFGADGERALELGWAVNNSAVTELLFSGARLSLSRFNVLSHLPDPATWTHR
jgi:broad specificity phosphatase PhoE